MICCRSWMSAQLPIQMRMFGLKDLMSGFAHLLCNCFFGLADLQATILLYLFTECHQIAQPSTALT